MTNLLDLDYEHLVSFIETFGEKPYRARQLMHWIYQESLIDFNEMTDISKVFREVLKHKTTLSDTRGALRRHFKVDAESIAVAVLQQLSNQGDIKKSIVTKAMEKYRIHDVSAADAGNTEGSG
jgi:adenine C2-methylase RlmN of 23S rRNA A2503 and tRNA A37